VVVGDPQGELAEVCVGFQAGKTAFDQGAVGQGLDELDVGAAPALKITH
jgi:hypothetical protein